jgi:hypothetical protein
VLALSVNDLVAKLPRAAVEAAKRFDRLPEDPDPLEVALSDALGEVRAFVNPERLNPETLRWAWLTIAAMRLMTRLNGPADYLVKEYDRVMSTLKQAAKGELPALYAELIPPNDSSVGSMNWGSNERRHFSHIR